jgi:catechol 2,3-dioxygenase
MSTHPVISEQSLPAVLRGERITYGAVALDVVDLERSLAFWREVIGLGELPSLPGETSLGVDGRALVVLRPGALRPAGRGHAGLYHLAIHVPDGFEFARTLMRIGQAQVPQSPTDHIFSKATYLQDPDGIMLEVTLETPERYRSIEIGPRTAYIVDSEGQRRGPTEPLDVAAAIAPLGDGDPHGPLGSGSYIGHVHLHVPDLATANTFYRDVIGFSEHAYMGAIGMADLSAGGRFPHRLAVNNWNGPKAAQAPAGTAGMNHYELLLHGGDGLEGLAARADAAALTPSRSEDGASSLRDPAGNEIVLAEAPA